MPPPFVPIQFLVIGYTDQAVVLRRGTSFDDDYAGFSVIRVKFSSDGQIFSQTLPVRSFAAVKHSTTFPTDSGHLF